MDPAAAAAANIPPTSSAPAAETDTSNVVVVVHDSKPTDDTATATGVSADPDASAAGAAPALHENEGRVYVPVNLDPLLRTRGEGSFRVASSESSTLPDLHPTSQNSMLNDDLPILPVAMSTNQVGGPNHNHHANDDASAASHVKLSMVHNRSRGVSTASGHDSFHAHAGYGSTDNGDNIHVASGDADSDDKTPLLLRKDQLYSSDPAGDKVEKASVHHGSTHSVHPITRLQMIKSTLFALIVVFCAIVLAVVPEFETEEEVTYLSYGTPSYLYPEHDRPKDLFQFVLMVEAQHPDLYVTMQKLEPSSEEWNSVSEPWHIARTFLESDETNMHAASSSSDGPVEISIKRRFDGGDGEYRFEVLFNETIPHDDSGEDENGGSDPHNSSDASTTNLRRRRAIRSAFRVHRRGSLPTFSRRASQQPTAGNSSQSADTSTLKLRSKIIGLSSAARYEVVYAALILVFVYGLIITDFIDRVLSAMIGALLVVTTLALVRERPSIDLLATWIDYETITLLFGMMIMVGALSFTGVFEYVGIVAYKLSKGNLWRLLVIVCGVTSVVSAFLDNVTTILLIAPVTIRLCQVIGVDPKPILIAEVVFSNIGGTATAIGDPPNVIIVSQNRVKEAGVTFADMTMHLAIGIIFCHFGTNFLLKYMYSGIIKRVDPVIAEIQREVRIWSKAMTSLSDSIPEEGHVLQLLRAKITSLEEEMARVASERRNIEDRSLQDLEKKHQINDKYLLYWCGGVLLVVILMFFIHQVPGVNLDLGWIALLGAITLLVGSGINFEEVIEKVEWATLLFFGALFIMMEGVAELGLLEWIGEGLSTFIQSVDPDSRLIVAIVVILWISAIVSACVDNIPFTTSMIPIIFDLSNSTDLPVKPLIWALAFGACLGGNGTLIGASANVVCAGVASSYGYNISFISFTKTGFPIMIFTVTISTVYLLVCHGLIGWNY